MCQNSLRYSQHTIFKIRRTTCTKHWLILSTKSNISNALHDYTNYFLSFCGYKQIQNSLCYFFLYSLYPNHAFILQFRFVLFDFFVLSIIHWASEFMIFYFSSVHSHKNGRRWCDRVYWKSLAWKWTRWPYKSRDKKKRKKHRRAEKHNYCNNNNNNDNDTIHTFTLFALLFFWRFWWSVGRMQTMNRKTFAYH